jgi:hypothetical protein
VVNIQNHPAFVEKLVLEHNLSRADFDILPSFPPLPLLDAQYDSFAMERTTKKGRDPWERHEKLGDSILKFVQTLMILKHYPRTTNYRITVYLCIATILIGSY